MFATFENHCRFTNYEQLEEYLNSLGLFHMDFGLERVRLALSILFPNGLPCKSAQIIGTNGKGSTAHFLASLSRAHGISAGLFTSPHLLSVRERVRVNGKQLPEAEWLACANIADAAQQQNPDAPLTYFEFVFAIALIAFARAGVKLAVLEAGLGGEYDATSAITADMVLFTPIDFDHEQILGNTLAEIAATKAGAVRPGQILLTAPQSPEALEVMRAKARVADNRLLKPSARQKFDYQLGLPGCQQSGNALLALTGYMQLAQKFSWPMYKPAIVRALKNTFIPGRMQLINPILNRPPILLDGAHHQHAFEALNKNIEAYRLRPRCLIFSCMSDKRLDAAISMLPAWTDGPIFVPPIANNPRSVCPQKLADRIGPKARPTGSLKEALHLAGQEPARACPPTVPGGWPEELRSPVLICGSLYLLGEFFRLHPGFLEPGRQNNTACG
ncbi:MAG: bifunctional folylpolyglutamate synthase/dihydrofolate synthase [Desulfovibrionaceae bacterium]|nr:bifunctional folylpolyglutamate synthase/dihydrofolate synthase [Desulfovibrionaceae bacterium]